MKIRLPIVTLGVLSLFASVAHPAEIGWEYERKVEVNEFDDTVTVIHGVFNEDSEKGIALACEEDAPFRVLFRGTGTPETVTTSGHTFVDVIVRVDKNPMKKFVGRMGNRFAVIEEGQMLVHIDFIIDFIHELMRGNKLIFQVGGSDTVNLSLAGSAGPISKLLKGCNISLPN